MPRMPATFLTVLCNKLGRESLVKIRLVLVRECERNVFGCV